MASASTAASITADDFASGSFTASDGTVLPYRLLAPASMEPGRRYPLVVQFHGSGAIGSDNRAQIEGDLAARAWAVPVLRARYPALDEAALPPAVALPEVSKVARFAWQAEVAKWTL